MTGTSVKGTCDVCGAGRARHVGAYRLDHTYTCAADDALRRLRKARFAGCAADRGHRVYDPVTKSYRITGIEPDVNECAHPLCFLGPHIDGMYSGCVVDVCDAACAGRHPHGYTPPQDATRLERMWRRRGWRMERRRAAHRQVDDERKAGTMNDAYRDAGRIKAERVREAMESIRAYAEGVGDVFGRPEDAGRLPFDTAWECAHVENRWRLVNNETWSLFEAARKERNERHRRCVDLAARVMELKTDARQRKAGEQLRAIRDRDTAIRRLTADLKAAQRGAKRADELRDMSARRQAALGETVNRILGSFAGTALPDVCASIVSAGTLDAWRALADSDGTAMVAGDEPMWPDDTAVPIWTTFPSVDADGQSEWRVLRLGMAVGRVFKVQATGWYNAFLGIEGGGSHGSYVGASRTIDGAIGLVREAADR